MAVKPQKYMVDGTAVLRLLQALETDGLEFVDSDGQPMGLHYHYDSKKGGVIVCRPIADFGYVWQAVGAERVNLPRDKMGEE